MSPDVVPLIASGAVPALNLYAGDHSTTSVSVGVVIGVCIECWQRPGKDDSSIASVRRCQKLWRRSAVLGGPWQLALSDHVRPRQSFASAFPRIDCTDAIVGVLPGVTGLCVYVVAS